MLLGMINERSVLHATREEIDLEIQRRLQKRNLSQIQSLIGEITKLKEISDSAARTSVVNAKSSNILSFVAISIAVISVIVQVLLSIHQTTRCRLAVESNTEPAQYVDCHKTFELGIFGEISYRIPDFTSPNI